MSISDSSALVNQITYTKQETKNKENNMETKSLLQMEAIIEYANYASELKRATVNLKTESCKIVKSESSYLGAVEIEAFTIEWVKRLFGV